MWRVKALPHLVGPHAMLETVARVQSIALASLHAPRSALPLQGVCSADPVLQQQAHASAGVVASFLWQRS